MADYRKAFKEGVKAAKAVELARRQIDETFEELNHQMHGETGGNIAIARKELERKKAIYDFTIAPKMYWAVVAYNPRIPDSPVKELAKWKQDRFGFPCNLVWGNAEHHCEDRESLEISLAELLRDPLVGEILYALTKLETDKQDESSAQE